MPFGHILGQATAVETLTRALRGGHVHHAYRFEGLDGVGKGLAATALAQALLCTAGDPLGCGRCDACQRVAELGTSEPRLPKHPDLVLVERGLYPHEAIGKDSPEVKDISVQQIRRVVLSRIAYPPHEGRAQIFIVRNAEQLSTGAANALLKTLEEPRPRTHFVLLTSSPERLLATIRSRSLPVRFGALPDDVVAGILRAHGVPDEHLALGVAMGGGSARVALEAADPEQGAQRAAFVRAVLVAMAGDTGAAVAFGESYEGDRRALESDLVAASAHFAREARRAAVAEPTQAERLARCHGLVSQAQDAVGRNASSALTLIDLALGLRRLHDPRQPLRAP